MQITDNAIINGLWGALVLVAGVLARIFWKSGARLFSRLNAVEKQMANAVTKTELDIFDRKVDSMVADVKREFKSDHKGLEGKLERIEDNLRKEIHESHASLQDGIDKVVNILVTRDENDRRRRGD